MYNNNSLLRLHGALSGIAAAVFCLLLAGGAGATEATAGAGRIVSLQDAYDAALGTNETIRSSEENVLQAEARVDQAWTYLYPKVTAQGAYTRYNEVLPQGGGSFIFQPLDQVTGSLVLTQPLYTGGRTLAGLRAAQAMREASRSGHASTRQAMLLSVAEAYYAVLKSQKFVEVSRNSLERMVRHKRVSEREASTRRTKATVSALLRANTLVNQARIVLMRAEEGQALARKHFMLLTNLPDDFSIGEPPVRSAPQGTEQEFRETALRQRDDYAAAQLNCKISGEFVTITAGAHYPQLYAEGGVRYQNSDPVTGLDATTYYGGVRLSIPLFEGGLMSAEVSEAKSRQRQAELTAALLGRRIETEIHEALTNYRTIDSVFETAKQQVEDARMNFETVEGLFSEGLASSLSLIDAEQALSLAEQELVSATWDRQMAVLRIERAIGLLGKKSES